MNDDCNYEVWVRTSNGKWGRVCDEKSKRDLWPTRASALLVAEGLAKDIRVVKVIGIKRNLSFTLMGHGVLHGDPAEEKTDGSNGAGAPAEPEGPLRDPIPDP